MSATFARSSRNLSNSEGKQIDLSQTWRAEGLLMLQFESVQMNENFTVEQKLIVIRLYLHWSPLPLRHLLSIKEEKK